MATFSWKGPNDLEGKLQLAESAVAEGRLDEAGQLAASLYEDMPNAARVHALIAELAGRAGNGEIARQWFGTALERDPNDAAIHARYAELLEVLGELDAAYRHFARAVALRPAPPYRLALANILDRIGEPDRAIEQLDALIALHPDMIAGWQMKGAIHRELGAADAAERAFQRAVELDAADELAQRSLAMSRVEAGARTDAAFGAIPQPMRAAPSIRLAEASARFVEGEGETAIAALETLVAEAPQDLAAQRALAEFRRQSGDDAQFLRSMEAALAATPRNGPLWAMMLRLRARAGKHVAVLEGVERARRAVGPSATLDVIEANAASALGDRPRAERLFGAIGSGSGGEALLAKIAFLLKTRRPEEVVRLTQPLLQTPLGAHLYPFVGIAWRLLNDSRWEWLEGNPDLVSSADLDVDVEELADVLRRLHIAQAQPIEQSLRGGTQTDGPLLMRHEPVLAALRSAFEAALDRHIAQLPAFDVSHPTLGQPRGPVRFTGCWSVRLTGKGFHVNHMHSEGWLSSAFYVALPESVSTGSGDRSGWLALGQPPSELDLDMTPTRYIEPRAGRLVIFPSTMWHGTLPFESGERLSVAFDAVPRSSGRAA